MNNRIKNQFETQVKSLLQSHNPHSIDLWLVKLLYVQLAKLGGLAANKSLLEFDAVAGLDEQFCRWWTESVEWFKPESLAALEKDELVLDYTLLNDPDVLWHKWDEYRSQYRHDHARSTQMNLVDACLRNLPHILTGSVQATEIIFPNSSMKKVEGIYKNNPVSDFFNQVLTQSVCDHLSSRLEHDSQANLRLAEIGAGTGGTTSMVLPALKTFQSRIHDYLYTDLSQAFLIHAKKTYGPDCSFLDYALWDIEQPLSGQVVTQGVYDVVIATNVLHATQDICQTLRHAKSALRKGGIIVINELSDKSMFTHLTFGLLKGWWLHEDTELRIPGSPALTPDTWQELLEEEGYNRVEFPIEIAHGLGQSIIIAHSDGIIRQTAQQPQQVHKAPSTEPRTVTNVQANHTQVSDCVIAALAHTVSILPDQIDVDQAFSEFGIDSILSVNFVNDVSQYFGMTLNPAVLYDYSSVSQLVDYILEQGVKAPVNAKHEIESTAHNQVQNKPAVVGLDVINQCVINSLAQTVKIAPEQIDSQAAFSDVGIDSILSVNFLGQVSETLSLTLNPALLYDYTSVEALSEHIASSYGDQVSIAQLVPVREANVPDVPDAPDVPDVPSAPLKTFDIDQPIHTKHGEMKHTNVESKESDVVAIIGMSGLFPGADDPQAFWQTLTTNQTGIQELPEEYLDQAEYFDAEGQTGKTYCKWGGIIKDKSCFDASFFNISSGDALSMSQHQRLALQESWKALEDAGYNPKSLSGESIGIYLGAEPSGYNQGSFTGSSEAIIASRLSYFLNLKGPALVVNTGCSSSAVAIHLACESLRNGETPMAIAGGLFASLDAGALVSLSGVGMLSHGPESPVFDTSADGMLLSEGAGVLVLKPLRQAEADGDPIYGVIRGSGINQDGASNGITAPSGTAQQALLQQVYTRHHIMPEDISYMEAHATGGRLGDTIEVNALARAFKTFTSKQGFCSLGSVKTHIGHTSAASGVIGIIKILLSMREGRLPGLLHYREANPLLELNDSAFYIQKEDTEWVSLNNKPLMAALNSFGHSGTNAHFVVQEYKNARPSSEAQGRFLIPLSAKTSDALLRQAENIHTYLQASRHSDTLTLSSLAFTLQQGREAMQHKLILMCGSVADCIEQLTRFLHGDEVQNLRHAQTKPANKKAQQINASHYQHQTLNNLSDSESSDLAQSWLQGKPVNWGSFYSQKPVRMHLPSYPFAKQLFRPSPENLKNTPQKPKNIMNINGVYPIGNVGLFDASNPWSRPFNSDHRILKNHKAFAQELLPGLAYIDLLFQFFRQKSFDYKALEMRNLSIHHPFIINQNYGVDAQITCKQVAGGYWELSIEGYEKGSEAGSEKSHEKSADDNRSELTLYITAEMHQVAPQDFDEHINVEALKKAATATLPLPEAYALFGGEDIQHTGAMIGQGVIHSLDEGNVIDIRVPEQPLENAQNYMFHPVLIDGCAVGSGNLFQEKNQEQNIFLPIYYESFRATDLMKGHCITRIRRDSVQQKKQLSYLTMEFFTPEGKKIGELKKFTCKLVREPGLINPSRTEPQFDKKVKAFVPPLQTGHSTIDETRGDGRDEGQESSLTSSLESVEHFLKKHLAKNLNCSADEIEVDIGYYELGLNSAGLLHLVKDLENTLKITLNPTLLFEYATVSELAEYLLEQHESKFKGLIDLEPAHVRSVNKAEHIQPLNTPRAVVPEIAGNGQQNQDIAVIGIAGRYPGANDMGAFWDNLKAGKDSVTQIPEDRWALNVLEGINSPSGKAIPQWGGFVQDVDCFDAEFFRVSPREAQWLDPQERLFLETCWASIEDAGYTPENLVAPVGKSKRKDVGVFVGVMHKDYALIAAEGVSKGNIMPLSMNYAPIANRVSYFCGFHGPSFAVDTVCSASLTALHLALESLRRGESKVALAGGVNLSLHPYKYLTYGLADMYASDGRCRAFGDGGNGFVSSEGVGAILLKPMAQAVSDKDNIYAVIKGSAINHVGHVSGITVPSPVAQADLMLRCYESAEIDPRTISYIEAHGTGTSLGDPIEVQGLIKAFRQHTSDSNFCALGSVKSNIGHAESAAGISGLSKVILQLHHKMLVPSLHSETVNPYLELDESPFYVQRELESWQQISDREGELLPRRAGISSFGATGSNAHIILEEYTPADINESSTNYDAVILPLSAKSQDRLKAVATRLKAFLDTHADAHSIDLQQLAFTLQTGRRVLEYKLVLVVGDVEELVQKLGEFADKKVLPDRCWQGQGKDKDTGFMSEHDSTVLISRWVEQKAWHKIARFWVEGFTLDWYQLYLAGIPGRMSLPAYPFTKDRHWIEAPVDLGRIDGMIPQPQEEKESVMFFCESWQEKPLPLTSASVSNGIQTLICFVSEEENQHRIRQQLNALNPDMTLTFVSQKNRQKGAIHWNRTDKKAQEQCFEQLISMGITSKNSGLLYLWPLEDKTCIRDFTLLQQLLTAMVKSGLVPAKVIFSGASQNSLERDYLQSWISIEKSMPPVLPDSKFALALNLDAGEGFGVIDDAWICCLYQELMSAGLESVCYQDGNRHVLKIHQQLLNDKIRSGGIKQGGCYLISGGLGELGFIFARYLASEYAAKLILTGRSALDDTKQAAIDELSNLGGDAHYIQADVSDASSMRFGLAQIKGVIGSINGVIHAAGLEASEPVFEKTAQQFEAIFSSKIEGSLILDDLLAQEPLDFVCYFSSSAAILGDFGSCDYAIGNRFQMSYGAQRNNDVKDGHKRGKTLIINWPFWKDGGMGAKDKDATEFYLKSSGQRGLETVEGIQVFEQLVAQTQGQYLVIAGKPSRVSQFLHLENTLEGVPRSIAVKTVEKIEKYPDVEALQTPSPILTPPNTEGNIKQRTVDHLKQQISQLLKTPQHRLSLDASFADFGFDSISLTELAQALTSSLRVDITPANFFGHSSIGQLADFLCNAHMPALEAMLIPAPHPQPAKQMNTERELDIKQAAVADRNGEKSVLLKTSEDEPTAPLSRALDIESKFQSVLEPIAVIGMSGRFPQADNVDDFWDKVAKGESCIGPMSDQRWDWQVVNQHKTQPEVPQWGAFMTDITQFDSAFFGIAPREAVDMDPRQRVFLQEAWHAFEDAGYMGTRIKGMSCGVYVGVEESDYGMLVGEQGSINGNQNATLAARIAYALDLNGPNLALTAACASGLVAVHQACQALRLGECEMALASGVNLLVTPWVYLSMNRTGMLSPSGEARIFDDKANGLVPGEAVAVVVLKSLSKAKADGDRIYGCIKASGVNYDGKTNGITAPNPVRQADLLKDVYSKYKVDPSDIQYVMSHSTGSQIGDPIEVLGLKDAFKHFTNKAQFCSLGSIKPLIGHTFAASGVVSLIAMLKAMQHKLIPATCGYEKSNKYITLDQSPFVIQTENLPWQVQGNKLRLGTISATGISGTNAHAVIEEYRVTTDGGLGQEPSPEVSVLAPVFVPVSAKTASSLYAYVQAYANLLAQKPNINLEQLAYSAQTGRDAMSKRVAFVTHSVVELERQLTSFIAGNELPGVYSGELSSVDDELSPSSVSAASMHDWLANNELNALADVWVKGEPIDWSEFYAQRSQPQRITLPLYPFQGKRFWASIPVASESAQPRVQPERSQQQFSQQPEAPELLNNVRNLLLQSMYFEEEEVGNQQAFTELGLNSVNAIAFIDVLNRTFGLSLTMKTIFEHPNLGALALYIGKKRQRGENIGAVSAASKDTNVQAPQAASTRSWLKNNPECIPLKGQQGIGHRFWLHPLTGSIGLYLKVADNLGETLPIWGIQSRGFLTSKSPLKSIEKMASYYIDILQASDPQGPYELAGYSMGGVIAYEMARQLQRAGYIVANLILLEPPFPSPESEPQTQDTSFCHLDALLMSANFFLHYGLRDVLSEHRVDVETLAFTEDDLQGYKQSELVPMLARSCIKKGVEQPFEIVRDKILSMSQILILNREAMADYHVKPLPDAGAIDTHYITIQASAYKTTEAYDKSSALAQNNRNVLGDALTHDESHCQKWLRFVPQAHLFRTQAQDHFHLLSDRNSIELISNRCREIYTKPAPTPQPSKRSSTQQQHENIAVVGMSGQFPSAKNLTQFWSLLVDGQSAFTALPADRDWGNTPSGFTGLGGFLTDTQYFDPLFFQISPNEAVMLDPCERLFLQESWKAVEDAGIDPLSLSGKRWGVLCGSSGDYAMRFAPGEHVSPNITLSQVPGRVSYSLNLRGPCQAVEAGCASSLLAIAQACDYLALGKCEAAIAGGALIYSTPHMLTSSAQFGLLSNGEQGCAFNAHANGMMPGESVGVVVLKLLSSALDDGDRVHGVIEAWGSNHNGKTNGMLSPGEDAQQALISEVYQRFDISAASIGLVEAHAAGMPMADSVEVSALTKAFEANSVARGEILSKQHCSLGSVENNIGHAFHNSGINHIFKALLAVKHKIIPGTVNVHSCDPALKLETSPFFINQQAQTWDVEQGQIRRAAMSSFGATGANVHLVVAEAPSHYLSKPVTKNIETPMVICLSARNEKGLPLVYDQLLNYLSEHATLNLKQVSANLMLRRSHFSCRRAFIVSNVLEFKHSLTRLLAGEGLTYGYEGQTHQEGVNDTLLLQVTGCVSSGLRTEQDLNMFARAYVEGLNLSKLDGLKKAFTDAECYPLSLPGYPFEKRICWAGSVQNQAVQSQTKETIAAVPEENNSEVEDGEIKNNVVGFLCELTGLSVTEIDLTEPLSCYGVDSLQGLKLLNRINAAFNLEFDAYLLARDSISSIIKEISQDLGRETQLDVRGKEDERPNFIHFETRDVQSEYLTQDDIQQAKSELGKLLQQGVAVWKTEKSLCFEYHVKNTHIQLNKLTQPYALWQALEFDKRYYPTSHTQKFILNESEIKKRSTFNIGQGFWLDMPVDVERLDNALNEMIEQHAILRTGVLDIEEQWVQVVHKNLTLNCQQVHWPEYKDKSSFEQALMTFQREMNNQLFLVNQKPMYEVYVVHNGVDLAAVFFATHHFHADGFTLYLCLEELYQRYQSLLQGKVFTAEKPRAEYGHFALSQYGEQTLKATQFWQQKLTGKRTDTLLQDNKLDDLFDKDKAGTLEIKISAEMLSKLQNANRRNNTTLTQLVTSALAALLYRITSVNMPIQMAYNLRDKYEYETVFGDFSSSVPMLLELESYFTLKHVLQAYEEAGLEVQKYKNFDFLTLQTLLAPKGQDAHDNTLLGSISVDSNDRDTFLNVTSFAKKLLPMAWADREPVAPLLVCLLKTDGKLSLPFLYDRNYFSADLIELLTKELEQVLHLIVESPDLPVAEIPVSEQLVNRLSPQKLIEMIN